MMRRMGATILEEPPTILSLQVYKLIDESETINLKGFFFFFRISFEFIRFKFVYNSLIYLLLKEGNTEEILKIKLEKYLPDFKRAVYAHIGIDQPHGRLICFADHINTKLLYSHQLTSDDKQYVIVT